MALQEFHTVSKLKMGLVLGLGLAIKETRKIRYVVNVENCLNRVRIGVGVHQENPQNNSNIDADKKNNDCLT